MNNTKWEEIRSAMLDSPNTHQWRTKVIKTGYICPWDGEWYYHFKLIVNWIVISSLSG